MTVSSLLSVAATLMAAQVEQEATAPTATTPAAPPTLAVPQGESVVPPPIAALPAPSPTATIPVLPRPRETFTIGEPPAPPRDEAPPATRPSRAVASPTPAPTSRETPRSSPTPDPLPSLSSDMAIGVPAGALPGAATPTSTPTRPAGAAPGGDAPTFWLYVAAAAAAVAILAALAVLLRRRKADEQIVAAEPSAPSPPAVSPPAPAPAPIAIALHARRAGVNLLTATAEVEVALSNVGDVPAEDVRVEVTLLSARADGEAQLAALFAAAPGRLANVPFSLAPGEGRDVRALATLPRGAIEVMTVAGRPIFVPVVAVDVRYRTAGRAAQVAQAFAVGIEREGAVKLMPFRLDVPARMHDALGVRPHGAPVAR